MAGAGARLVDDHPLRRHGGRGVFVCALLLAAWPAPAATQLMVSGTRDLTFGLVLPPVPTVVAPGDASRSGAFDIVAAQGDRLRVRLTLPNTLAGSAGATLAISFARGDAIGLIPGQAPVVMNPSATKIFNLGPQDRMQILLGGQVSPTGTQAAGSYAGTVVLTVTVF